jgi:hypothetical protein
MQRFKDDPMLKSILETMRTKGGKKMTAAQWAALRATEVGATQHDRTVTSLDGTSGWYQVSYLWAEVSMAAYIHAKDSAVKAQQKLYTVQACDRICGSLPQGHSSADLYREFLEEPNVNTTMRLPSFCYLHLGLRVRILLNLLPPFVTTDSTGTVVGLEGLEDSSKEFQARPPRNVLVKVDDLMTEFLSPTPCGCHEEAQRDCQQCRFYPGVVVVCPKKAKWKFFLDKDQKTHVKVGRCQLPLFPLTPLTLYQMQGTTADPGLIAHFSWPSRSDPPRKWLILYVLLSRPRSLANLRSFGLDRPEVRKLMEGGPPEQVIGEFDAAFSEKIRMTHEMARKALEKCGW